MPPEDVSYDVEELNARLKELERRVSALEHPGQMHPAHHEAHPAPAIANFVPVEAAPSQPFHDIATTSGNYFVTLTVSVDEWVAQSMAVKGRAAFTRATFVAYKLPIQLKHRTVRSNRDPLGHSQMRVRFLWHCRERLRASSNPIASIEIFRAPPSSVGKPQSANIQRQSVSTSTSVRSQETLCSIGSPTDFAEYRIRR